MAQVYSTRFIQSRAGATQLYTVGAGFKAVIRCVTVNNTGPVTQSWQLFFNGGGGIVSGQMGSYEIIAGQCIVIGDLRVVLNPEEVVEWSADSDVDATVSGYLLTPP